MPKRRIYRIAVLAAGLVILWFVGDLLQNRDCPEFTVEEAAIAEAFTLVRGEERGEWPGGLNLEVVDVLDSDQCGGLMGGGWIRFGSKIKIEVSGALSNTIGLDISRDGPVSDPQSSPNPTISWYTGFHESDRISGMRATGSEEIDRNHLAPFLEGGVLEIEMRIDDGSELGLYIVRDSGVVAVRHGDSFWGDRGVRDRVFVTIAG